MFMLCRVMLCYVLLCYYSIFVITLQDFVWKLLCSETSNKKAPPSQAGLGYLASPTGFEPVLPP